MIIDNISGVSESLVEIGERIKSIRIAACYTQEDLARRAGVSLSSVQRIEKGQSVHLDIFLSVLKALNILSKMDAAVPVQKISPMEQLKGEKKKKIYRKKTNSKPEWTWGD